MKQISLTDSDLFKSLIEIEEDELYIDLHNDYYCNQLIFVENKGVLQLHFMSINQVYKKAIVEFVKLHEEIDLKVKAKVASLKRGVMEGSPEWDIMYKKYYEEEMGRHGQN